MNAELRLALDGAYEVFGRYDDSEKFARLSGVTRSLRDLTRDDWDKMEGEFDMRVQVYEENVLRYFLPLLLTWYFEIHASASNFGWPDSYDLSYHLNRMRWLEWPADEAESLRTVFAAWTREELTKHDGESTLGFLTDIEADLTRYLDIWLEIRPHELGQWLWTVDWAKQESVLLWAVAPRVEERLEAAFFQHPDGEQGRILSRSIELVRSMRG